MAHSPPQIQCEESPDVVAFTLRMVTARAQDFIAACAVIDTDPEKITELLRQIEKSVKEQIGGRRLYMHKRGPRMTPEARAAAYQDGLTKLSNDDIQKKHKISRATLYNIMKTGGGRFS